MGEELRRAEKERRADEAFRERLGGYMAVTGRSLADLAAALGVSTQTMYNYKADPGQMRMREYRRLMDLMERRS
jgi:Zn-dependent peptidase ImmA (M78 family)